MSYGCSAASKVPTDLYRLTDAQARLLYVGISNCTRKRFSWHARRSSWWPLVVGIDITHYLNRREAMLAEHEAIATEHPIHNRDAGQRGVETFPTGGSGNGVDPADLLGPHELAALLNIDRNTLNVWRSRGKLLAPSLVLSEMPIWTREAVQRWLGQSPEGGASTA